MDGGNRSAECTAVEADVLDEFGGATAEFEMAATVDGCDESIDVAMSSSLDVAASSLLYIVVSIDLDAAIGLSMGMTWYAGAW